MNTMRLRIVALDRMMYDDDVQKVTAVTTAGEITVLPHHMDQSSVLRDAPLIVVNAEGEKEIMAVHQGYMSIKGNEILVVADEALFAREIDEERTRENLKLNQAVIENPEHEDSTDIDRAKIRIQRELTNLKVYNMFHK